MTNPLAVSGWMFRALPRLFAKHAFKKFQELTGKIQCRDNIRSFLEAV